MEIEGTVLYAKMEKLLGKGWGDRGLIVLERSGYVPVYFRKSSDTYSLETYWEFKGVPLEDPQIVFHLDHQQKSIQVVSQEGYFHHSGPYPDKNFKEVIRQDGSIDPVMNKEVSQYFGDWLDFLLETEWRPVQAR